MRALRNERGSATLWGLALGMLLLFGAVVAVGAGRAVTARHHVGGVADLAALAAAEQTALGRTAACRAAGELASVQGARLTSCTLRGERVTVVAEEPVRGLPGLAGALPPAVARARAGPPNAGPAPPDQRSGTSAVRHPSAPAAPLGGLPAVRPPTAAHGRARRSPAGPDPGCRDPRRRRVRPGRRPAPHRHVRGRPARRPPPPIACSARPTRPSASPVPSVPPAPVRAGDVPASLPGPRTAAARQSPNVVARPRTGPAPADGRWRGQAVRPPHGPMTVP